MTGATPRFGADHAQAIARLALLGFVLGAAWILLHPAGPDQGPVVGFDFASFWSASTLTWRGEAAAAYDQAAHFAVQRQLFGAGLTHWAAFFYPPVFLLVCAPLALLPFGWSLLAWTLAGMTACILALRRVAGGGWITVPALAFPAFWVNAGFGQNGAITAALFGWAAVTLDRRPVVAGACLGCLCFKPQIGLAIPVALIAARRWRALAAAAGTVAALCTASVIAFGPPAWAGFLAQAPIAAAGLEQGVVGFERIVSPFATIRMAGGGVVAAYAVQAIAAAAACLWLALLLHHRPGGAAEVSAIVAATLFCSPFLLVYDLAIMAVPLAWLAARLHAAGAAARGEVAALALLVLTPLLGWAGTRLAGIQVAPLVSLLLVLLVARRIAQSADA